MNGKGEFGGGASFLIGILISAIGSPLFPLVIYVLVSEKFEERWKVLRVFFGLIIMLALMAVLFGLNLLEGIWSSPL